MDARVLCLRPAIRLSPASPDLGAANQVCAGRIARLGAASQRTRIDADDRRWRYVRAPQSDREYGRDFRTARLLRTISKREGRPSLVTRGRAPGRTPFLRRNLRAV